MNTVPPPPEIRTDVDRSFGRLKRELHRQLLSCVDMHALRSLEEDQLRVEFRRGVEQLCRRRPDLINLAERQRLIDEVVDESLGFGPLEPLLRDPSVSDILVNGYNSVFVERAGVLQATDVSFINEDHLVQVIQKIASKAGRRIDESSPMVDARLPDGSRLNAVIRPLAVEGALVSIRRIAGKPLTADDLLQKDTLSKEMLYFLIACVRARLNIIVSGGTGSGKTTLLNTLSSFIPADQRIVTIEDSAELRLQQPHVARMETRPANVEGVGEIRTRDLVRNALRMRPDRIVIGECRGEEALDMLQAMNTGHDGSLTTLHANSAVDAIGRLQMLVGMAGIDLPIWHIDRQIASGVHMIVHVMRLSGGPRKMTQICEVAGLEDGRLKLRDIFRYRETGLDPQGRSVGVFEATGEVPAAVAKMRSGELPLGKSLFTPRSVAQ